MKWPKACLGDVAQVVSGATPKSSVGHYWDGDIPWITPADLSSLEGKEVSATTRRITEAGLSSCSSRILPPRSVLFSSRAPIGHVAINTVPMATNQGFKSFVPNHEILSSDFLYWWLKSNKVYLQSLGRGATFKEVSKEIVESIEIPLPPLEEQRRIAAILDKTDQLASLQVRASIIGKEWLFSIYNECFADSEAHISISIEEALESQVLLLHKDGNHGSSYPRAEDFAADGVPFISAKSIGDRGAIIDSLVARLSDEKAQSLRIGWLEPGDVLLAHNASVGKTALYEGQYQRAVIGTSLTAFRPNRNHLRAPRIIRNFQGLYGHKKAAEEAAEQENLLSTIDEIA
jgi:type I restriction enzyme S subunit